MLGFNGGLMGVQRTPTQGVASGLWFQNEQSVARRAAIWPSTGVYRYYRFNNFASTALESNVIDFGEIELYDGDTKHTGITCTTNWTFDSGSASVLVDGFTAETRAYYLSWSSVRSTATITFDLGTAKPVTHVKVFSLYEQPRFPASFDLQGSSDNSSYSTLATVTVGSLSLVSGITYASEKVAI